MAFNRGWLFRVPTGQEAGQEGPRSIRIELRISHDELASMVGTTRPRASLFMGRLKHLGLIETSLEHHLII
jgi:CRP-like cAMP-binding protein